MSKNFDEKVMLTMHVCNPDLKKDALMMGVGGGGKGTLQLVVTYLPYLYNVSND